MICHSPILWGGWLADGRLLFGGDAIGTQGGYLALRGTPKDFVDALANWQKETDGRYDMGLHRAQSAMACLVQPLPVTGSVAYCSRSPIASPNALSAIPSRCAQRCRRSATRRRWPKRRRPDAEYFRGAEQDYEKLRRDFVEGGAPRTRWTPTNIIFASRSMARRRRR